MNCTLVPLLLRDGLLRREARPLRNNESYALEAFSKALRWGIQLAFLLHRPYFPCDKWLMAHFSHLPRLHTPLAPPVEEAVLLETGRSRKLELLRAMAEVLDATMVEEGLIRPHPSCRGSESSATASSNTPTPS